MSGLYGLDVLRLDALCLDTLCLDTLHLRDGRRFHNIDASLEIRSVINHYAGGLDIAHKTAVLVNCDLVGGFNITLNVPDDHHLTRPDVGLDLPSRPDCQSLLQLEL